MVDVLNLILWMTFIVIAYLCYEKWRTNKLIDKKADEIYQKIMADQQRKKHLKIQKNIENFKSNAKNELRKKNTKCFLRIKGMGDIHIELYDSIVPKTAENFRELCRQKRYVGTPFHRVIKGFMIQGGDYENGNGTGGKSIWGGNFADENFELKHWEAGLLSMANAGPGTNGSQFFILTQPKGHLDGKHVVFGKVIQGMDVVYRIERTPVNFEDKPIHDVVIEDCGILGSS